MSASSTSNRKLLSLTVLLAVLPVAICIPDLRPAPDDAAPRAESILMTEVNADGVRVIVD